MKRWRCEDGHETQAEQQPRACTHTRLGYVMRATDALVVPPACGKPLTEIVDCLSCGKPSLGKWYCDDCWSDKQGGYSDG